MNDDVPSIAYSSNRPTIDSAVKAHVPVLNVDDVSLGYDLEGRSKKIVIEHASLTLTGADRCMLIGPSGCGKSTLLKALAGLQPVLQGEIEINGRRVTRSGQETAMVFQEFDQLMPWRNVAENVAYALRVVKGQKRKQAMVSALHYIDMVGMSHAVSSYPHQLSGGMKQRVAIARAFALEPGLMLLDEPFAALDALSRATLQNELYALWERNQRPFVFVTHSIEEAVRLGSKIVVMKPNPGRISEVIENEASGLDPESVEFRATCDRLHGLLT